MKGGEIMSIDKDSLIIVQAITEGIAVACKKLQQLEPAGADEEEQPEEEPEEDNE
jgi:hypothetical protein